MYIAFLPYYAFMGLGALGLDVNDVGAAAVILGALTVACGFPTEPNEPLGALGVADIVGFLGFNTDDNPNALATCLPNRVSAILL
jgi:hypothetical protein